MTNDFDFAFGGLPVAQAEATPVVEGKRKMAVKNVAKSTDEALMKKLRDHGVEVSESTNRTDLIALLKQHRLWDYSGNVVDPKFKQKYAKNGGNCGDPVSKAFLSVEGPEKLRAIAEANGIDFDKWSHCNPGAQRMNLSNVLRGRIRRGESAIIETTEWINGVLVMLDGVEIEQADSEAEA